MGLAEASCDLNMCLDFVEDLQRWKGFRHEFGDDNAPGCGLEVSRESGQQRLYRNCSLVSKKAGDNPSPETCEPERLPAPLVQAAKRRQISITRRMRFSNVHKS